MLFKLHVKVVCCPDQPMPIYCQSEAERVAGDGTEAVTSHVVMLRRQFRTFQRFKAQKGTDPVTDYMLLL